MRGGNLRAIIGQPSSLIGIPFDRPVVGYGGKTINTLRLWAAAAHDYFNFQEFSSGDFVGALAETLEAESLTRVLYPDDSTSQGQGLRFMQEYFLVACSLADLVRRFQASNADWSALPGKVAIQLNDTHPALAVPELMRILLDDARLGWDEAWDLTQKTLGYTNHTLLPEALEKWPLAWFEISCRVTWRLSWRSIGVSSTRFGIVFRRRGTRRARQPRRGRRPAQDSHGQSGDRRLAQHQRSRRHTLAAAAHNDGQRLAEIYPERFSNKTNGVTPRRWLLMANPALARTITAAIGDGWMTDLSQLRKLKPLADDRALRDDFRKAKREAKTKFVDWLKRTSGETVDPDSIFDCQIKRIHEYKRQLLNALRVVVLYNRLRENPNLEMPSRTFFFSGKAAPAYQLAKVIIKFINNLAGTIDGDSAMRGRLKVLFLPEYCVSLAERLIPASDVSNQIQPPATKPAARAT